MNGLTDRYMAHTQTHSTRGARGDERGRGQKHATYRTLEETGWLNWKRMLSYAIRIAMALMISIEL